MKKWIDIMVAIAVVIVIRLFAILLFQVSSDWLFGCDIGALIILVFYAIQPAQKQ